MKYLAIILCSFACVVISFGAADAHEGMVALFADEAASDCDSDLVPGQSVFLYLFYMRGNGPEYGNCCAIQLLSSSPGIQLHSFTIHPIPGGIALGTITDGIGFCNYVGEAYCATDMDAVLLGRITVLNISEDGPFTISVVGNPKEQKPSLAITLCDSGRTKYAVIGGAFVFNAVCESPECGAGPLGGYNSSWGAIKSIYAE